MTTSLTLVRPDDRVREEIGNDGLTDAERENFAEGYRATVARRSISAAEKQAYATFLAKRAGS